MSSHQAFSPMYTYQHVHQHSLSVPLAVFISCSVTPMRNMVSIANTKADIAQYNSSYRRGIYSYSRNSILEFAVHEGSSLSLVLGTAYRESRVSFFCEVHTLTENCLLPWLILLWSVYVSVDL